MSTRNSQARFKSHNSVLLTCIWQAKRGWGREEGENVCQRKRHLYKKNIKDHKCYVTRSRMHILVYNILWVLVVIGKGCVHWERERERERKKEEGKHTNKSSMSLCSFYWKNEGKIKAVWLTSEYSWRVLKNAKDCINKSLTSCCFVL